MVTRQAAAAAAAAEAVVVAAITAAAAATAIELALSTLGVGIYKRRGAVRRNGSRWVGATPGYADGRFRCCPAGGAATTPASLRAFASPAGPQPFVGKGDRRSCPVVAVEQCTNTSTRFVLIVQSTP